jgi:GH15 family glucan-1,4-alpha-glucosidase
MLNDLNYLPIADHGVIGDLRTVALVGTDATIDWYCCPRFDSPSVFGSILGTDKGGFYRIAPTDECSTKQLYFPDTNVLVTRFLSPTGVAEVQDFMPIGASQRLVRRVVCIVASCPSGSSASPASTTAATATR